MIIVSACLVGINCNYQGKSAENPAIVSLVKEGKAIPVCPEQLGGLGTPRIPAEIQESKVINQKGEDVTEKFRKGAEEVLRLAKLTDCHRAILKENSPSCGSSFVYDGSFSRKLITGNGITTGLLRQNKIDVISEKDMTDDILL